MPLRTVFAFLIAPAVPAVIIYLVSLITAGKHWEGVWSASLLLTFGYIAAVFLGIPVYLILRNKGLTQLSVYAITGVCLGLVMYLVIFVPNAITQSKLGGDAWLLMLRNSLGPAIVAGVSGLVAAVVFWLVAIRRIGTPA